MRTVSRRRFLEAGAATGLGASALRAQEWARNAVEKSPRRREWVTVKHGGRAVESVVVHPRPAGKAPAMIVIHEIFGMTDWVENVADEFAEAGYLAIAPDLLSGMAANGGRTKDLPSGEVGQTIRKLPPDQITADLNAVADYVKSLPGCNGKVCVVGFSWGGSQCFRFATNRKDLSAACVFYGSGPDAESIPRIQAPVFGFYGENDARINATVPATQEQMKAAGKVFEAVTYKGAAHGFMRAGAAPDGSEANKEARAAAWVKLKALRERFK
jgi:carboxymethylenebutenolidase